MAPDKQNFSVKFDSFLTHQFKHVLKKRLNETVLLSTHNICFGWVIRRIFNYTLLSGGLIIISCTGLYSKYVPIVT